MLIEWKDSYSVHIEELDAQHRKLFNSYNHLAESIDSGESIQVLHRVLASLVIYTLTHFEAEEKLLALHGYPGCAKHKEDHDELLKKVIDLKNKYTAGKADLDVNILEFLREWILNHVIVEDKKYSDFLKEKGVT